MKFRTFMVVLVAASPAMALAGVFGTEEGCIRHAGGEPRSDSAWILTKTELLAHESACTIEGETALGDGRTRLETVCSGEGSTWKQDYIVEPTSDADVVLLAPADSPDFKTELRACR